MRRLEIRRAGDEIDRVALGRLLTAATIADGRHPLSDHLRMELDHGGRPGFAALTVAGPDGLVGYAQLAATNDVRTVELVIDPGARDDSALAEDLLSAAVGVVADDGGGRVQWWAFDADDADDTLAAAAGLALSRSLHQMRRDLPTGIPVDVVTRPFVPGRDEAAWLAVNNRAFAAHPEQGGWTEDTLEQREQEPWFDPAGFLLHERDGRLAAFCWTKVHTDEEPVLGEIYVIAVDPDFQGLGLGRDLTLAGLAAIAGGGVRVGMLYVDADNTAAVAMYDKLGFVVHRTDRAYTADIAGDDQAAVIESPELPRWDVTDVHESITARSFVAALEGLGADVDRLVAAFDEHEVRAVDARPVTPADGNVADAILGLCNDALRAAAELRAYVYASVTTDSRDGHAQSVLSEIDAVGARITPLLARLADWVRALDPAELATVSDAAREHAVPLLRLAERSAHQMSEPEEGLYAELATTGSAAWARMHSDVTSQLATDVALPGGRVERLPLTAVRGLATHADPAVRRAAYDAELAAWPLAAVPAAAALNAIKGEGNTVNRRRRWASPLDASLYANAVGRRTFDAMQSAVTDALGDFQRWMRVKAGLHGHAEGGLPWWDLVAPLPMAPADVSWTEGVELVRTAFSAYSPLLGGLVDRAIDERWIDAPPCDGKRGGAFCMSFVGDRSLVLMNWSGSIDSAQTAAHELGHAYHNTTLAGRTPLQRRLPMALAETASIFCETLVVEEGLRHLDGVDRLPLLDVDLQGAVQVVVDIRSRFLFETEVFARRQRRTLGVGELDDAMRSAQAAAYGDGLDQATAHPSMWVVKPHYYSSHFYNWPYTYGLLFGLGLFARFRDDPDRFRAGYDDVLSRAGMDTAEELGLAFGLDVTTEAFWTASLDVLRERMAEYERLAAQIAGLPAVTGTRFDADREHLGTLLAGEPRYRVDQVWQGLYERLATVPEMTNLPARLRERLDDELPLALAAVTESVSDRGDTVKFLWGLGGGARIETVLMLFPDRATVCVSSQAGCAMACGFCATGQAGFTRQLSTGEIVEQVVRASRRARDGGRRVSNVVFMGMGEPLANEPAVWGAVERLHGDLGLSARHVTISTVGIVPGIRRLAERHLPVTLAVSLHAANDALRDELVPINRRYPLDAVMAACSDYLAINRRRLSFEWAMIDGVNDRPSDAAELAALCRQLRPAAHVNLIPLNPTPGWPTKGTAPAGVAAFRDRLVALGVNATVRRNRGTDIDAACGQLAAGTPVMMTSRPTR